MSAFQARNNLDSQQVGAEFKRIQDALDFSAVTDIATADGSDPATTQALANACKAKINEILAVLRGD